MAAGYGGAVPFLPTAHVCNTEVFAASVSFQRELSHHRPHPFGLDPAPGGLASLNRPAFFGPVF